MARAPRPKMAFWIHQLVEYLVAVLLAAQALQSPRPEVPLLAGAVFVVLAATADGPLAAFHAVPRPVHRVVDAAVAAGFLALAVVIGARTDGTGRVLLVVAAAVLGALVWRTDYRPRTPPVRPAAGGGAEDLGRAMGRAVGRGVRAYRDRDAGAPGSDPPAP